MSRGNRTPSPLDTALTQAEVLATEYDDYDEQAALDRIARRVVWNKAGAMERRARCARHMNGRPEDREQPTQRTAVHARAAAHLGVLSSRVVRDPAAIAAMTLLVDDRATIEPAGALAFACLLYLADRHEAAQFWWQFAAGAGSSTAAHCLYLQHLQHSEHCSALHWHHQAVLLYDEGRDPTLSEAPARIESGADALMLTGPVDLVVECKRRPCHQRAFEARWWIFTSSLNEAVLRLDIDADDDFGTIPKPDPDLAAELEGAATT